MKTSLTFAILICIIVFSTALGVDKDFLNEPYQDGGFALIGPEIKLPEPGVALTVYNCTLFNKAGRKGFFKREQIACCVLLRLNILALPTDTQDLLSQKWIAHPRQRRHEQAFGP